MFIVGDRTVFSCLISSHDAYQSSSDFSSFNDVLKATIKRDLVEAVFGLFGYKITISEALVDLWCCLHQMFHVCYEYSIPSCVVGVIICSKPGHHALEGRHVKLPVTTSQCLCECQENRHKVDVLLPEGKC